MTNGLPHGSTSIDGSSLRSRTSPLSIARRLPVTRISRGGMVRSASTTAPRHAARDARNRSIVARRAAASRAGPVRWVTRNSGGSRSSARSAPSASRAEANLTALPRSRDAATRATSSVGRTGIASNASSRPSAQGAKASSASSTPQYPRTAAVGRPARSATSTSTEAVSPGRHVLAVGRAVTRRDRPRATRTVDSLPAIASASSRPARSASTPARSGSRGSESRPLPCSTATKRVLRTVPSRASSTNATPSGPESSTSSVSPTVATRRLGRTSKRSAEPRSATVITRSTRGRPGAWTPTTSEAAAGVHESVPRPSGPSSTARGASCGTVTMTSPGPSPRISRRPGRPTTGSSSGSSASVGGGAEPSTSTVRSTARPSASATRIFRRWPAPSARDATAKTTRPSPSVRASEGSGRGPSSSDHACTLAPTTGLPFTYRETTTRETSSPARIRSSDGSQTTVKLGVSKARTRSGAEAEAPATVAVTAIGPGRCSTRWNVVDATPAVDVRTRCSASASRRTTSASATGRPLVARWTRTRTCASSVGRYNARSVTTLTRTPVRTVKGNRSAPTTRKAGPTGASSGTDRRASRSPRASVTPRASATVRSPMTRARRSPTPATGTPAFEPEKTTRGANGAPASATSAARTRRSRKPTSCATVQARA